MKLRIDIVMENAVFFDPAEDETIFPDPAIAAAEVAHIIAGAQGKLRLMIAGCGIEESADFGLYDTNGNSVGRIQVST